MAKGKIQKTDMPNKPLQNQTKQKADGLAHEKQAIYLTFSVLLLL